GYGENGDIERAVNLLHRLKVYLERNYMGNRIKATMYSTILPNLVQYLGLGGYYEHALKIAEETIDIFKEIGKTYYVSLMHYDIAWIYSQMDKEKYKQKIKDEYLISLFADLSNKNYSSMLETIQYLQSEEDDLMDSPSLRHLLDVYCRMAPEYYQKLKLPDRQP
ncbi:MAG: hypothetical protein IJ390_12165, partial [Lachnospiraceae bacterium]|nr:hypothetical protein [Lachnospiraceae bacterium]